jgi:hypothetical protein
VASSVQAAGLGNVPESGEELKLTSPPGVPTGLEAVSVTVALHVVAVPVAGDDGEHKTVVDVASMAAADEGTVKTPINTASVANKRRRAMIT